MVKEEKKRESKHQRSTQPTVANLNIKEITWKPWAGNEFYKTKTMILEQHPGPQMKTAILANTLIFGLVRPYAEDLVEPSNL